MSSDNGVARDGELTGLSEDGDVRTEEMAAAAAALAVDSDAEVATSDEDEDLAEADVVADDSDDSEDADDSDDADCDHLFSRFSPFAGSAFVFPARTALNC